VGVSLPVLIPEGRRARPARAGGPRWPAGGGAC
jgi:hypothetical protein